MFEWTDPREVKNYTQYYLYLLFSYQGRIGRADFARGLFFGYFPLIIITVIGLILSIEFIFRNITSLLGFVFLVVLMAVIIGFLVLTPPLALIQKRLKDIGFSSDTRALIIVGALIGTIAWLLGPILLIFICLASTEQKFGNPYGKECTVYEDLKRRRENLVNAAESCLGRNDFEGAIQNYTELGDNGLVKRTKKAHISHNYDLLYSQISRMNGKGVLCEDLVNSTSDLSSLVNSYLGIKPQEPPSTLPKSDDRLSFSESESGKEELKAE